MIFEAKKREPDGTTGNEGVCDRHHAFETHDFCLACFLRGAGYELLDLRPEGSRNVQGGSVQALAYADTINDVKALLHNA
jgi:hypothetical protein